MLDKGTLGTKGWDHIRKNRLPRYQWTFLEGRTRLRFLAWSHQPTLTNGLCFMAGVMLWLRAYGIKRKVVWQTDWGEEFGGSKPAKLQRLQETYYKPLGAPLARIPKGMKGYNGRVALFVGKVRTEAGLFKKGAGWEYYYNMVRPHYGAGMDGKPPFQKLPELGHNLPEEFASFPPVVLDTFSATWALEGGNNLLAYRIYPDIWSIFNKLNRDQGPTVGLGIREFVMAWRYEDRVVQYLLAVEGTDGIPSVVQRALKSKRRLKG